jgi:hypothetical protein
MTINHQVRLAARPVGLPKPTDWSHAEVATDRNYARAA